MWGKYLILIVSSLITLDQMFGLFKKTNWKMEGKALGFFRHLFGALGADYAFLIEGLNKGIYQKYSTNYGFKNNAYTIWFDPDQSDRSMVKGKRFRLENIMVIHNMEKHLINLTVDEGLWIGFECEKEILNFDAFEVDLSKLKCLTITQINNKVKSLVTGLLSDRLDLDDLNVIEIGGKTYYQIKDLENGNYIAVDIKGQVFGLIHDPFKIELLNISLKQFVAEVNNGQFNFEKYLKK